MTQTKFKSKMKPSVSREISEALSYLKSLKRIFSSRHDILYIHLNIHLNGDSFAKSKLLSKTHNRTQILGNAGYLI